MARINRLESLLVSAMANNTASQADGAPLPFTPGRPAYASPVSGDAEQGMQIAGPELESGAVAEIVQEFGSMKVDQAQNSSIYLGGAHWVTIMSEVTSLLSL